MATYPMFCRVIAELTKRRAQLVIRDREQSQAIHTEGYPSFELWAVSAQLDIFREWFQTHGYPEYLGILDQFQEQYQSDPHRANAVCQIPVLQALQENTADLDRLNGLAGSRDFGFGMRDQAHNDLCYKMLCCARIVDYFARNGNKYPLPPTAIAALRESRACRWAQPPVYLVQRQPGCGPKQYTPIKLCRELHTALN